MLIFHPPVIIALNYFAKLFKHLMRKTNRTAVLICRVSEDSPNKRRLHTFIPTNNLNNKKAFSTQ